MDPNSEQRLIFRAALLEDFLSFLASLPGVRYKICENLWGMVPGGPVRCDVHSLRGHFEIVIRTYPCSSRYEPLGSYAVSDMTVDSSRMMQVRRGQVHLFYQEVEALLVSTRPPNSNRVVAGSEIASAIDLRSL